MQTINDPKSKDVSDHESVIAQLRGRFLDRCDERVSTMRCLVRDIVEARNLSNCDAVGDSIKQLIALAHEITGGGGTFGCSGLSQISAELEAYLACCDAGRRSFDEDCVSRFIDRLSQNILAQ